MPAMPFSTMRNEEDYMTWNQDAWNQMREESAHKHLQQHQLPGAWYYEEETAASCSPVSEADDMAQFLNYRTSIGVQNVTESVDVPTSEHVAEIVGRQGCKIKALRAKTNTYIKTPIRGEDPVFVVTGRPEDVAEAKREIECAADHFTQIRASRRHTQVVPGAHAPGQVTSYVRVPLRVVGLVVGPKGATIKRIQQDTHTYIITPSREREPVFEVTGLPHNVDAARKEIETHIFQRTGNLPETEKNFCPAHHQYAQQQPTVSLMMQKQQQQAAALQAQQAQQQQQMMYQRKMAAAAYANSNLFNQMADLPFGMESSLGLDALLRSFPSMRNSLTPDSLSGFGKAKQPPSRPSLGGGQPVKQYDVPAYDYWGTNNSINDIMENEILSRKYDAIPSWSASSAVGFEKELMKHQQHKMREESPTNGLMSLKGNCASSGFGFLNIWSDNNLSPGSLPSASPASSNCDHNDHTLVPISG
uniref:KH domain-containing protein n=1 Tax=Caenorhabditis tropicalis TaxID=1561998 RepID=A0A1I7TXK4_9PELO